MIKPSNRILPAAVLLLCSAKSVTGWTFNHSPTHQREPVTVTATRTAQTADAVLASMTVITREDIERQQVRSVHDLLRGAPGINIVNNGGPGKSTFMQMRGTETDQILVLIDGIKVGNATSGTTPFENIPIEQIERIEIVRGPRSSLYGSEAIGGVIQIFTRRGDGKKGFRPTFSFGGGSYGSLNGSIGLSGNNKQGWFNLTESGSHLNFIRKVERYMNFWNGNFIDDKHIKMFIRMALAPECARSNRQTCSRGQR